jgi:hypothetical protein
MLAIKARCLSTSEFSACSIVARSIVARSIVARAERGISIFSDQRLLGYHLLDMRNFLRNGNRSHTKAISYDFLTGVLTA